MKYLIIDNYDRTVAEEDNLDHAWRIKEQFNSFGGNTLSAKIVTVRG